jgi:hypothetical protein
MVPYLPNLTSVTCSSGTFKLKKITSALLAIPISRDACVDHHRPPQPSNQRYRRLRWSKAANFTRWFEVAGATACLICHRQVGPFDGGSISPHFSSPLQNSHRHGRRSPLNAPDHVQSTPQHGSALGSLVERE